MIWAIYALYEQVFECVRCASGLSNCFTSTIGVKQGCPLSSTLFGTYIDEICVTSMCLTKRIDIDRWSYASKHIRFLWRIGQRWLSSTFELLSCLEFTY